MHGDSSDSTTSSPRASLDPESLRGLLAHIPAAAYVCDERGLITSFNRRAVELWGREPQPGESVARLFAPLRLYSSDGRQVSFDETAFAPGLHSRPAGDGAELIVERPSGSRAQLQAHWIPLWSAAGATMGAVCVLAEASEYNSDAAAARFLASIVESSDDAIVSEDLDGRILTWNAGAERLFGYSAGEAVGGPITLIIPAELQSEEHTILERLRRGEWIEHYETWRIDKQGRRRPISLSASPIRDETGQIVGAAKMARDITAQKEAAAALLELRQAQDTQLADLLRLQQMSLELSTTHDLEPILREALRTACAISNTDRGLLSLHDLQQRRLTIGASMGLDDAFVQRLERDGPAVGACGRCFRERRRVIIEDVATDPAFDGVHDVALAAGIRAVHSTPLITREGKMVGVLSLAFAQSRRPTDHEIRLLDVCARQAVDFIENARLYQELREADRRKDQFLAVLAHELRNPLAPLANSLQIMRLSNDVGPALDSLRAIMETQVQHLVRLVDDLLDVSRITRGKIDLRKEQVELSSIIDTAVETSRPHLDAAGQQLEVERDAEAIQLDADPVRLAQVISNLLNNASKYTPHRGHIRLTVSVDGAQANISVRDDGQGIAPEMLSGIFDMFSRIERAGTHPQNGLGLGLAVSRELVEMHGGEIEAHSDGLGCGSCFTVRLPIISAPAPESAKVRPGAEPAPCIPQRRVVVVDDTRVAAYTLGRLLETLGQKVFVAYDGPTALELARSQHPHIIISDIAMPDMDGYELAERVRESPDLKNVTLIALTGYGHDGDRDRTRAAGFDNHLVKPVGIRDLQEVLTALPSAELE